MRLSDHDRSAIVRVTAELAGPRARVLLFGSRTRDDLRGGDIDLLIELPDVTPQRLLLGDRIGARLQRTIGLRRIDVLVADPATPATPVLLAARRDGVELVAVEGMA
jgi:predicted nucleotidyltransferase